MFTAKDALYEAMAYTDKKVKGGGGGGVTPVPLTVTENGTYTAEVGQAYNPVIVNVPTYDSNSILYITAVYPEDYMYDIVVTKDIISSEDVQNLRSLLTAAHDLTIASRFVSDSSFSDFDIGNNLIFTSSMSELLGFSGCYIHGNVIFQGSITVIGENSFSYANFGNTSLVIPEGVIAIQTGAFTACSLGYNSESESYDYDGTVTLPSTLATLGAGAIGFSSSTLNNVHLIVLATVPPHIENDSISISEGSKIYVPAESVDAYKSAENWSYFADIIEAIPTE